MNGWLRIIVLALLIFPSVGRAQMTGGSSLSADIDRLAKDVESRSLSGGGTFTRIPSFRTGSSKPPRRSPNICAALDSN